MIGSYALPSDDVAPTATGVTASAEDAGYLAANLVSESPSRPAKLTTTSGFWDITLPAPVALVGAAVIYHNLDAGLNVTLEATAFSQAITIPTPHEDGWTVSPFVSFAAQTDDVWRLSINGTNSLAVMVGRLILLTSIRQTSSDVRWGVQEDEEHVLIEQQTEVGVELPIGLGGVTGGKAPKRRSFSGEMALQAADAAALSTLRRSAVGRLKPWFLIPDTAVNDAWIVRFTDPIGSRVREIIDHNIIPLRVKELSRGLPWP